MALSDQVMTLEGLNGPEAAPCNCGPPRAASNGLTGFLASVYGLPHRGGDLSGLGGLGDFYLGQRLDASDLCPMQLDGGGSVMIPCDANPGPRPASAKEQAAWRVALQKASWGTLPQGNGNPGDYIEVQRGMIDFDRYRDKDNRLVGKFFDGTTLRIKPITGGILDKPIAWAHDNLCWLVGAGAGAAASNPGAGAAAKAACEALKGGGSAPPPPVPGADTPGDLTGASGMTYPAGSVARFNETRKVFAIYAPLAAQPTLKAQTTMTTSTAIRSTSFRPSAAASLVRTGVSGVGIFGPLSAVASSKVPPPGTVKAGEEQTLPSGIPNTGNEKDPSALPWLVGGALVVIAGALYLRMRK